MLQSRTTVRVIQFSHERSGLIATGKPASGCTVTRIFGFDILGSPRLCEISYCGKHFPNATSGLSGPSSRIFRRSSAHTTFFLSAESRSTFASQATYWMLNTTANALAISRSTASDSLPRRLTNRSCASDRTWKASAAEGLSRPFSASGWRSHHPWRNTVTILPLGNGDDYLERQYPYRVIIHNDGRAGFLDLPPMAGSRLMSQISPLCMQILAIESLEAGQLTVRCVVSKQGLCRRAQLGLRIPSRKL